MTDLEAINAQVQSARMDVVARMDQLETFSEDIIAAAEAYAEAIRLEAEHLAAAPGRVNFFRDGSAGNDFDKTYLAAPTVEQQAWMCDHYHRMRVYSPWFDTRTSWFPNGLVYQDAYAIYTNSSSAANPWVLKDLAGVPVFIPFGAKPYAQYAADITHPAFRADWIAKAKAKLAKGYKGLFVDDVNYYRRTVRADGSTPASCSSFGGVLNDALWRVSMALFMAEIRQAIPNTEIVHNVIWQVPETPEVAFGLRQCDFVEKELGVNDSGLTGGTGKFSLRALLDWVDRRHAAGVGVIWDSQAKGDAQREYGLACYLLTSDGSDMLGSREGGTPGDWWAGYDTVLGKPLDDRERLLPSGLHYRQFERGHVYANEPGAAPFTLTDGRVLGPASGAVILSAEQAIRSAREEHRERKTI